MFSTKILYRLLRRFFKVTVLRENKQLFILTSPPETVALFSSHNTERSHHLWNRHSSPSPSPHSCLAWMEPATSLLPVSGESLFQDVFCKRGPITRSAGTGLCQLPLCHHFTTEKKSFHCVVMGKPSLPAGELVNPRPESLNCSGGINVFHGSLGGDWYPNHRKPEL